MSESRLWIKYDPENPPPENTVFEVVYASSISYTGPISPFYIPSHAFLSEGEWLHRVGFIEITTPETVYYREPEPVDLPVEVSQAVNDYNQRVIEFYTKRDGVFKSEEHPLTDPHYVKHAM